MIWGQILTTSLVMVPLTIIFYYLYRNIYQSNKEPDLRIIRLIQKHSNLAFEIARHGIVFAEPGKMAYWPKWARLEYRRQVSAWSQEGLVVIFGRSKIKVAYAIFFLKEVSPGEWVFVSDRALSPPAFKFRRKKQKTA
jgi:hypothetical protein